MKNLLSLLCFLLGFTIFGAVVLHADDKTENTVTEYECLRNLMICEKSCVERSGILTFACLGQNVSNDNKSRCRCIDD